MTDTEILSCDGVCKHFEEAGHRLDVLTGTVQTPSSRVPDAASSKPAERPEPSAGSRQEEIR